MISRQMPGKLIAFICFSFFACTVYARDAASPSIAAQGSLQAAFAPWDDIEGLIKASIDQARQQVLVQAYLFTNRRIADALIAAKRRGVDVQILADARKHAEVPGSRLSALASAGIAVWLEVDYENAHNKIILIDPATPDATVITGSFNFTWTAQHRNAENILVARKNPSLAARYEMNWIRHRQQAEPFKK
jgi:phosphatidylserine/phosphatidylglycerophosphate/cardiolipin synthase-like enzyme